MKIGMPSGASLISFGRVTLSYAMGAVTMAAGFHFITQNQAQSIGQAIEQIANGITSIAGGVATLVTVGTGLWAAYRVSRGAQVTTVSNITGTHVVVDTNKAPADLVAAALDPTQPKIITTAEAAKLSVQPTILKP